MRCYNIRNLDQILAPLSLHDADEVIHLTCRLCCLHQKTAFQEGLRFGAQLHAELVR